VSWCSSRSRRSGPRTAPCPFSCRPVSSAEQDCFRLYCGATKSAARPLSGSEIGFPITGNPTTSSFHSGALVIDVEGFTGAIDVAQQRWARWRLCENDFISKLGLSLPTCWSYMRTMTRLPLEAPRVGAISRLAIPLSRGAITPRLSGFPDHKDLFRARDPR